ncbi:MAG: PTS glucose transporter subunit IIA, partial [Anaerobacillus sp.]
ATSTITPIVFTNLEEGETIDLSKEGTVSREDKDIITISK